MRHLKSYKLFESRPTPQSARVEVDEIVSILNDMILEIRDKDLNTRVELRKNFGNDFLELLQDNPFYFTSWKSHYPDIEVLIESHSFRFNDIKNDIFQIIDFIKEQGWEIKDINTEDDSGIYRKQYNIENIIEWFTNHRESLYSFRIKFTKSKI
jgi:hypothetical protein